MERQRRYGSQACYKRSAIRKTSLNLPDAPLRRFRQFQEVQYYQGVSLSVQQGRAGRFSNTSAFLMRISAPARRSDRAKIPTTFSRVYFSGATLTIHQFNKHPQSFGGGRHSRRSLMARRRPRVNHESLPRASFAGRRSGHFFRRELNSREFRATCLRPLPRARDPAGRCGADGCRDRCLCARKSRERLSSVRYLPDGAGGRSAGGGRSSVLRDRGRGAASDRIPRSCQRSPPAT